MYTVSNTWHQSGLQDRFHNYMLLLVQKLLLLLDFNLMLLVPKLLLVNKLPQLLHEILLLVNKICLQDTLKHFNNKKSSVDSKFCSNYHVNDVFSKTFLFSVKLRQSLEVNFKGNCC